MNWVVFSLFSAVAFTAYSVAQKRTLDRHVRGPAAFSALACVMHGAVASVILFFAPPDWLSWSVAAVILAGSVHAGIQILTAYAFRREGDVTRIVPVLDAYPLFVLVLAVALLDESLTPIKWGAVGLVVAGVVIASQRQNPAGERLSLFNPSVIAVIGASVGIALYSVLAKMAMAMGGMSILQIYAVSWLAALPWTFGAAWFADRAQLKAALASPPALWGSGAAQAALFAAFITGFIAFESGPVSLSAALMSIRPVLLLLWVALGTISLRSMLSRPHVSGDGRARWASAGLVVLGAGGMAL